MEIKFPIVRDKLLVVDHCVTKRKITQATQTTTIVWVEMWKCTFTIQIYDYLSWAFLQVIIAAKCIIDYYYERFLEWLQKMKTPSPALQYQPSSGTVRDNSIRP